MKRKIMCRGIFLVLILLCVSFAAHGAQRGPAFSQESGFYRQGFMLEITCRQEGAIIYYTLDGSAPDQYGQLYEGPLEMGMTVGLSDPLSQITGVNVEEDFIPLQDFPTAHVIRTRALLPHGEWTEESCATYFVGYDRKALYGDLPIISLMMDERDLFDYEHGIYVLGKIFEEWDAQQTAPYDPWELAANYTGRGMEWEREVMVDFMMGEGDDFSQLMGVRIKGGASRSGTQKSLRLIAREDYGEKNIKYPFYPDNFREYDGKLLEKYKSVTLRSGGNDRDFGRIRDPLISNLASGLAFETAKNRPVIAFINGEYWGLYTLNEEYSDNYIQYHYDIDNENVITFKTNEVDDGEEEDGALYWQMFDFITGNNMADEAHYEKASEMLDMQSFADFVALQLYIYNQDGIFENNNWEMWRVRIPGQDDSPYADGKWRMMLYDTDYSSGIYESGKNFKTNNIRNALSASYDDWHPGRMVQSLLKNPAFEKMLILSLSDIRSLFFTGPRVNAMVERMRAEYAPYMTDTFRRMGPMWVAQWDPENHLRNNMNAISAFFTGRASHFHTLMRNAFQLKNMVTITVKVSGKGHVLINGREIPVTNNQKIYYYPESPITVTAVPGENAAFTGWKINNRNAQAEDLTAPTTSVTFKNAFTITAQFR